jgi:dTDP-glucose pyrophosphorylase
MSGLGSRFTISGYKKPKPLIEFFNKSMIEHVIYNIGLNNKFTLVMQKSHYDTNQELFFNLSKKVEQLNLVFVDTVTRGAAESCLLAKQFINLDEPLIITNCDQLFKLHNNTCITDNLIDNNLDGLILVFEKNTPEYSYVEVNENNIALRTAEKQVISKHATTGVYIWAKGKDFIWAAEKMIKENIKMNNEFYVCPVFNQNIQRGDIIGIYEPLEHNNIGTPYDLQTFINNNLNNIEQYHVGEII